jgi:hypothetical protein
MYRIDRERQAKCGKAEGCEDNRIAFNRTVVTVSREEVVPE